MQEYMNMWKNYANFSDRTDLRGYWMAFLFNVIAAFVLGLIGALLKTNLLGGLYSLAGLVPGIALSVRRLRDCGKKWTYLFISLIPLVGTILLIVQLCKPSVADDGVPVV